MKQQEKNSFKKKALVLIWFLENPYGPTGSLWFQNSQKISYHKSQMLMVMMQVFIKL